MKGSELAQYMLRHGTDAKPLQHQQNYDLPYTPTSPERILPQIQENDDLFGVKDSSSDNHDMNQDDSSSDSIERNNEPKDAQFNDNIQSPLKYGKKGKDYSMSDSKAINIVIADDEVFKLQRAQKYQPKGVRTLDQLKNDIDSVCVDNPNQITNIQTQQNNESQNNKSKLDQRTELMVHHKRDSTIQQDKHMINQVMEEKNQYLVDSIKKKFNKSPNRVQSPRSNSVALKSTPQSRASKLSKYSHVKRKSQLEPVDDGQKIDSNIESKLSVKSPKKSVCKSRMSNSPSKLSRKWSKSDVKVVTPKPLKRIVKKNTDALGLQGDNTLPKIKIKTQFVPMTFETEEEQKMFENQTQNNSSRELTGQELNAQKPNFKEKPLVINVAFTQYEVMADVAKETNFKLSYDEEDREDWDVWWIDGQILPTLLQKMANYQRVNHLPNVKVLASKNLLARNLNLMQKAMPELYDFFPQTFVLPADLKSFKEQFTAKRAKTFIVKPDFQCQGLGIFLTRGYEWIQQGEHYVAQKYLHKPYLIDKLKFDLRIYILVTGISPLRAFIYKEGLARFATEEYHSPMGPNLNNLCMHLTNYAINKEQPGFQQNQNPDRDDIGHKRSMTAILKHIDNARTEENELPTGDEVWQEIKDICVKTLFSGIHSIEHLFRTSKPQDIENSLCFQIFGFDIFLDEKCKPWLIEVNHSPSFLTESPLDYNIKKNILRDSLHMLNLSWRRKNRYLNQQRNEKEKRLVDIQKLSARQKLTEKEQMREAKQKQKDQYENSNMGDFQNLYPLPKGVSQEQDELQSLYDLIYFKKSRHVYDETLSGGGIAKTKKEIEQKRAEYDIPDPHVQHVSPNKKSTIAAMRNSQAMSSTNYKQSPTKSNNFKSQRDKNYSLAFPLNKVGLDQETYGTNDLAQQQFYDQLNSKIIQNEARISQKKDQINSTSLNKIREFIESTNSQQSEYRSPQVTIDRDNIINQKYYNHGMNIANIKQKHKWDGVPALSPNSQIDVKYKLSPREKDFDPRLLCLPDKPDVHSNKKFLASRTNRDVQSKADNLSSNTLRVSDQLQNRTQQNFINYVGPPQEIEDSNYSNQNTLKMPQIYSANSNHHAKNFSSDFTNQTSQMSSLSQVELSKSNNKFMKDAKAFANFISKNQMQNGIKNLDAQYAYSQGDQSLKNQLQKSYQKSVFSNSLKVHFPLKKQTIAQMQANKRINGPYSFSNNLDSIISEMEVTRKDQNQYINQQQQSSLSEIVASQPRQSQNAVLTQQGSPQTNNSLQMFLTIPNRDAYQGHQHKNMLNREQNTLMSAKNSLNQKLKPLTYNSPPKTQKKTNKSNLVMTGNSYLSPLGEPTPKKINYNNQQ